jgi:hypothetical protein
MKHLHRVEPDPLPDGDATQAVPLVESSTDADAVAQHLPEVLLYARGAIPCRCGRYLSEDFDGRLFCRGCEGTDRADITPRLPLCRRPQ